MGKDEVIEDIENFGYDGRGERPRKELRGEDVYDIAVSAIDAGSETVEEVQDALNDVLGYTGGNELTEVETSRVLDTDERASYNPALSNHVALTEDVKRTRARIERDYLDEDLGEYLERQGF